MRVRCENRKSCSSPVSPCFNICKQCEIFLYHDFLQRNCSSCFTCKGCNKSRRGICTSDHIYRCKYCIIISGCSNGSLVQPQICLSGNKQSLGICYQWNR